MTKKERAAAYAKTYRATPYGKKKNRETWERWRLNNPEKGMWNTARRRAKEKNIPFSITVFDIIIPEKCPILGIPLVWQVGHKVCKPNSPSLDRIKPELGYVPGNVAVISMRANNLKSDGTLAEHSAIVEWLKCFEDR
jgi:hypothetical protein